ncbi:MAG TPA: hypothetical protein VGG28_09645 [Kofleriaceae bacterium]|jgi:hypothetical protein
MKLRVRAELPTGELRHPRGSAIAIAGVAVLALIVTLRIAFLEQAIGEYQASEIVHSLDAIYLESIVIALVLWRRGGSAIERSVVIGLFAMALWPVLPVFLTHADFVEGTLVTWQMLVGAWLVAFAIGAALVQRRWPERRLEVTALPPRPIGWKLVAAGVVVIAIWAAYLTLVDHSQVHTRAWLDPRYMTTYQPWRRTYATLATLVVETLAVSATLAARVRFTLISRATMIVAFMLVSAIGVLGTSEIVDTVAAWNGLVVVWLAAVIVAIKAARIWRELVARHRRGF